jgi:hypothetical protein
LMHQFAVAGRAGRHDGEGKVRASSKFGDIEGSRKEQPACQSRASRGDLRMWGKIAAEAIGAGDWLVGSWSADGVPHWVPRMHYYSRDERKLYLVRPNVVPPNMELIVDQEDKALDPARANFIIENIETWVRELQPDAS